MSSAFDDPSPAAFEGALAIFTLTTLYLHSSYGEARYQNNFLVAAVVATVIISSARYYMFPDEALVHSVRISLPTSIVIASIANATIHRLRTLATSRQPEPEWKQEEKTLAEGQGKGEKQGS